MNNLTELEQVVVDNWLSVGSITLDSYGSENTYYVDEFDNEYFCKNYPNGPVVDAWRAGYNTGYLVATNRE